MAIVPVQRVANAAGNVKNETASVQAATTSGHVLVAAWRGGSGSTLTGVTDTQDLTRGAWQIVSQSGGSNATSAVAIRVLSATLGVLGTSDTITFTQSGSSQANDFTVWEYSGIDTTTPVETGTNVGSSGSSQTSSSLAIAAAAVTDALFMAIGTGTVAAVITNTDGHFAARDTGTGGVNLFDDLSAGTTSSITSTWAYSPSTNVGLAGVALKAATYTPATGTASDSVATISDSATRAAIARSRTSSDAVATISDTARVSQVAWIRKTSDTVAISDATGSHAYTGSAGDSFSISDVAARAGLSFLRGLSDSAAISDALARTLVAPRATADSLSVADALSRTYLTHRSPSDSFSISDASKQTHALHKTTADSVASISDAVGRQVTTPRATADSFSIADTTGGSHSYQGTSSDSFSVSDASVRSSALIRALADSLAVSDAVVVRKTYLRTAADSLAVSDLAKPRYALLRSSADTWTVFDSLTRTITRITIASDAVSLADQAQSLRGTVRSAQDTFSILDQVGNVNSFYRSSSDIVTLSDLAVGIYHKTVPVFYGEGSMVMYAPLPAKITLDPSALAALYMTVDPSSTVTVVDPALATGVLADG